MSLGVFYIMKLFYNQIVVRVIQLYETLKTSDLYALLRVAFMECELNINEVFIF